MSKNMYSDSVKQWNCFVGCKFNCTYCKKSFQAQMKRQKHNCIKCYNYEPHFHEERLTNDWIEKNLPEITKGDEFIWCCSSGDIYFAKPKWIFKIIEKIKELPSKTFFFQSKEPKVFCDYDFPENVILGITLESNRWYKNISNAPSPLERMKVFFTLKYPRKFITIEPILDFDFSIFLGWLRILNPERIYIGYDTKKNSLLEPRLYKTRNLIHELKRFSKVKTKYMKD